MITLNKYNLIVDKLVKNFLKLENITILDFVW